MPDLATEPLERLTWHEICERYPDRWVVLANIARSSRTDFAFTADFIGTFTERNAATPR